MVRPNQAARAKSVEKISQVMKNENHEQKNLRLECLQKRQPQQVKNKSE